MSIGHSKTLTLVSWENERVTVPLTLMDSVSFLDHIPDIDQEIRLEMIDIDSSTLHKIILFSKIEEKLPIIEPPITAETEVYDNQSPYFNFFRKLNEEELLLLILAAHKLDYKNLQRLCTIQIAKIFADVPESTIQEEQSIDELTVDQEDYLHYDSIKLKSKI